MTVGSRNFQFDRLLKAVDESIITGEIKDTVFAQIGLSKYIPHNYDSVNFLDHHRFNKIIAECDVIITHGGTGVIINAVKKGKRVIAVPRLKQYGEAIDNHQIQLVKEFEKSNFITACYDCDDIAKAITKAKIAPQKAYKSNTDTIINSIDTFIKKLYKE